MLPDVFIQTLEANRIRLRKAAARALVEQFQAPNGAVSITKFLGWIALSAPADHANPELRFVRLPQPYRRIVKVLESDILDAAWELITTQSLQYRLEMAAAANAGGLTARSSCTNVGDTSAAADSARHMFGHDYDAARKRCCKPTRQLDLASATQHIDAIVSHFVAPFVAVVVGDEVPRDDAESSSSVQLKFVSTPPLAPTQDDIDPFDTLEPCYVTWWTPDTNDQSAGAVATPTATVRTTIRVAAVSSLQPLFGSSTSFESTSHFCLAVRLVNTSTTTEPPAVGDTTSETKTTTVEQAQVSVFVINSNHAKALESPGLPWCRRIAVLNDDADASATIELSQDVRFLALNSISGGTVLYRLPAADQVSTDDNEVEPPPLVDLSISTVPMTLSGTTMAKVALPPQIHFLVAPATDFDAKTRQCVAPITTYAIVVCVGKRVLKFVLPTTDSATPGQTSATAGGAASSTVAAPVAATSLAPIVDWRHLSCVTASCTDSTTEFLTVACEDGAIVVWNVLRDRDHAFMSTASAARSTAPTLAGGQSAVISSLLYLGGYIVALSILQQRAWFFDVRRRSSPMLLRVVTPPVSKGRGGRLGMSSTSLSSDVRLVSLMNTMRLSDLPLVALQYSNGSVILHDLRSARAIGSFRSGGSVTTAPASLQPLSTMNAAANAGLTVVATNKTALIAAGGTSEQSQQATIDVYTWEHLLLTSLPSLGEDLQQTTTDSISIKGLFIAMETNNSDKSGHDATHDAEDFLESLVYRLAGQTPPRSEGISSIAMPSAAKSPGIAPENPRLQPCLPTSAAQFRQYCDIHTDPQTMAAKEAKVLRRRREILKAMSATAG